jgi:amino acid adenylation domain-containing protein
MPGVAEEMFTAYQEHLNGIIESEQPRDQLLLPAVPTRFMERRVAANNTARELPKGTLFDFIRDACDRFPENKAVVTPERVISYRELWGMSSRLAAKLRNCGVGRNDLVAICASKGWQQVVAAISVIQAGAAYLPVSVELPRARKSYLLAQERVKVVLAEHAQLNDLLVPVGVQALVLEDCFASQDGMQAQLLDPGLQQDDLAYVIFTSGSTGTPKGVAIDHRGVVNTLQDVIRRFGLTSSDRVIGISAFNFDLSVYDIFATLGSGAALVLPKYNQTPDPDEWARCVKQHGVTVWNTVPALLEMMVEFLGTQAKAFLSSLRLIMLSGDWIPLSLPGRIKEIAPGSAIVSLGGATEASIWSNYFIVDHVDPSWKSVPYGWPLSNQVFHVLDKNMQPVPNWVSGELYIGGIGLAKEYYQDPERTAASFVTHPQSGERLYRTGDLGRYHDSGYIEFLGRNDGQIKIRGYRIELGEIESALEQCHGVRGGAVVVRTVVKGDKQLVAFAVLYKEQDDGSIESVREHLARQLPDYMVPQHIVVLEQMPVTANGKVDRKRLLEMAGNLSDKGEEKELPRNETEKRLSAIWCRLLKLDSVGVEDNFFELGGSSLTAVRLLRMIEDEFDKKIELASLFRFGSIALQAQHLQDAVVSHSSRPLNTGSSLVKIREGAGNSILAVVHPVGGNILCYRSLIELVPREVAVVGLQSPGDGKPRTVNELATAYAEAIAPMLTRAGMKVDILGWSMGGVVGHEMTRLLEVKGFKIGSLTMIDSWMGTKTATPADTLDGFPLLRNFVKDFLMGKGLPSGFDEIVNRAPEEWISAALKELEHASSVAGYLSAAEFSRLLGEYQCNFNALIRHRPGLVRARVNQFRASRAKDFPFLEPFSQGGQHDGAVDFTSVTVMNEDHFSIMQAQALQYIVGSIFQPQKHLRELESV